jgi:acyl carrier protein
MHSYEEIVQLIVQELTPYAKADETIEAGTDLTKDLGLDSVNVMEMMLEIEDRFDIAVPVNRLADVHTVDDLARAIQALLTENQDGAAG